ncbi:rplP [Symbiodinium pilosum]|uniref:RplP protein n=1 Tax=Symbiodinium pilosum TaxID=2952 RepID=A0A812P3E1_SYMPI|nr:rplP [Symbiodinium pilosum]
MSPNWQPHKVYLPQGLASFVVVGEASQENGMASPNSQSSPIHVQAIPLPMGAQMQRDCQAIPLAPAGVPMQRDAQAYPFTAPGAPVMPMRDFQAVPMQGPLHARPMPQEAKAFVVAHPGPNATPLQHEWQAYPMESSSSSPSSMQNENQAYMQGPQRPASQMPLETFEGQVTTPVPPGVPSEGSIGHPELCRRPCFYFAKGCCTNGLDCGYCHAQHGEKAPKLDKRQRMVLQSLPENMLLEMLMSHVQEKAEEKRMTSAMADIMDLWQKRLAYLAVNPPVVSAEDAENLAERYVRNLDKILRRMNISELIALAIRSAKEEQGYVGDLREAKRKAVQRQLFPEAEENQQNWRAVQRALAVKGFSMAATSTNAAYERGADPLQLQLELQSSGRLDGQKAPAGHGSVAPRRAAAPRTAATTSATSAPLTSAALVCIAGVTAALSVRTRATASPVVTQALGDAGAALPPAATTFAGASVAAISATSGAEDSSESKTKRRMLMPKNIKWRKPHKPPVKPWDTNRWKYKGEAWRGNKPYFGKYALQILEEAWINAPNIEACRRMMVRTLRKDGGKVWLRCFPHSAITWRGKETRMGGGKGTIQYWVQSVRPGYILFEVDGCSEETARRAFHYMIKYLPFKAHGHTAVFLHSGLCLSVTYRFRLQRDLRCETVELQPLGAPGMLIRSRIGSFSTAVSLCVGNVFADGNGHNITSTSYVSNGYTRTGTANPVHRHQGRITAGKRSRRGGEGQGTVGAPAPTGGSALLSVPTPIRSTSAPSLPGEALVFEVTTKSPEPRKGAVSPLQHTAASPQPVAQTTQLTQPVPAQPAQPAPPAPQPVSQPPPVLPQTTEVPTEQGIVNHLPWLSEKRTTLLQLLAEWSQSHRVLDDLTDRLRRLGRDRPADQGPCELEPGRLSRLKPLDAWKCAAGKLSARGFAASKDSACFLHKRPVRSVNFSCDGQLLCTSSEDGTARVYELETGRMVKEVDHGTTIWWSDFSRDGSMLCTASDDRSVRVYDCKTWKLLEMFGHGLPAKCASFSPDGQTVATASGDAFVRIFDLECGDEVAKLKHDSWVISVRYSPDGKLLATGSADKWIRVFDATSPVKLVSKRKFIGLVTSVDFSPDSRLICASTTRTEDQTQIIDVESGRREVAIEQDALTVSARPAIRTVSDDCSF